MVEASNSVTINRSPQEVFAFISDGTTNPLWRAGVLEIEHRSGTGVGSIYRQRVRGPGGRPIAADYEITRYEPPRLLAFRTIAGPARPEGEFSIDTAPGGASQVTFRLWWKPIGMKRFMTPMVRKTMRAEVAALQEMKEAIERG